MFDAYCPRHRRRVLLFPANIWSLINHPDGIELRWQCFCGEFGATWFDRPKFEGISRRDSSRSRRSAVTPISRFSRALRTGTVRSSFYGRLYGYRRDQ